MKRFLFAVLTVLALSTQAFAQQPIGTAEGYAYGPANGVGAMSYAYGSQTTPFDIEEFGPNVYGRAAWSRGVPPITNPVLARAEGVALTQQLQVGTLFFEFEKVQAYAFVGGNCLTQLIPDFTFDILNAKVTRNGVVTTLNGPFIPNTMIDLGDGNTLVMNQRSTSGDGINIMEARITGIRVLTGGIDYRIGSALAKVDCQSVSVELQSFGIE